MTICPCCGFKSESTLINGCKACGARPVGEPLPRPERELPSYGRSLLLAVSGALLALTFLTQTFLALTQRSSRGATSNLAFFSMIPFDFWSWVAAAETAAWRLKWVMIPVTLLVIFGGRKLYRSIAQSPARFCGLRYARLGYLAAAAVPLLIVVLIGVTVPERLRHRQEGIRAGFNAQSYASDRVLLQYREQFGMLPSEWQDLVRLPDPDGSIAALLRDVDGAGYKVQGADIATLPKQKPRTLRGAALRNASITLADDDTLSTELSFPSYELRLPGWDKILGTEDDLIVRDGVITKASETPRRLGSTTASSEAAKP